MYIPVTLRDHKGRVVKKFDLNGSSKLQAVTLFIWRDMFLSILAHGSREHKAAIPRMLSDIENALGWKALVGVMYGRPKGTSS